ncbi:hypothetical protein F4803DRAFT_46883 [Xylaria telfairii]|nr:hypothetical protein F4803DRAFT_46883 [Xylaria telfairii]
MAALANFASLTPSQQEQLLNSPALQPPPGVQPNFYDPPNANNIVYPTIILALLLSFLSILLRIHGRWYCMKTVKIQDAMGIVAFFLFVAELSIYLEQIRQPNARGLFVHQWNIQVRDLRPFFLRQLIISNLYSGMMLLLKTAILIDWLQTFSPPGDRGAFYWACILAIIANELLWIIALVLVNAACVPYAAIYDKTIPGHCFDNHELRNVIVGIFNFIIDVMILVLPQRVIWKLRMSTMKRLGLSFVFAVGILTCVSALVRLIFTITSLHADDITYAYSAVGLWTVAEITCGFIVFSVIATSKSFASFKRGKIISRFRSQQNSTIGGPSGHQSPSTRWKFVRSISAKSNDYSEIERQNFTSLELSTFGETIGIPTVPLARARNSPL